MSSSKVDKATKRIHFGYYAYVAGPMGDVFQFLLRNKTHTTQKGKKMALEAISAFWKPFSAEALLDVSDRETQMIARRSIDELQKQIVLIQNTFNLRPEYSQLVTRREMERILDVRLNQHDYGSQREETASHFPVPDNYNARAIQTPNKQTENDYWS